MSLPTIPVIGNLTGDPELRYTSSGVAVVSFTVATTPRVFDRAANEWKDGDSLFLKCSAWRELAENIANSFKKGDRVIAHGTLKQKNWETREGEKRSGVEVEIDEIGPSVRYATVTITKNARNNNGGGGNAPRSYAAQNEAPRNNGNGHSVEEPPF